MPISMDDWNAAGPARPTTPTLPMQVPGGDIGAAVGEAQKLQTESKSAEQAKNYELYNGAMGIAGSAAALGNLYEQADKANANIFTFQPAGQLAGHGGAAPFGFDIARQVRQSRINSKAEGWEKDQEAENLAGAIDSMQTRLALDTQKYSHIPRGGSGSNVEEGAGQSGTMARGNIQMIRDAIGTRRNDTLGGLKSKLQQAWEPAFDGLGRAIANDPNTYSYERVAQELQPYLPGMQPSQIIQGLKLRRYPGSLPGAGGAPEANRAKHMPAAASPLPGQGADHGDAEGPGRHEIQAGIAGTRDVTDRSGMERTEPGLLLPPMPKQFNQARAFQYERAMQVLQQHPELASEWDKRFAPGFPGTGKMLLRQMQERGQ